MKTTDYRKVVEDAKNHLAPLGRPENIAKYARFFREEYDGYGVPEADFLAYLETVVVQYAEWDPQDVIALGDLSFATGKYELGSLAILWLARLKDRFERGTLDGVRGWFEHGVANWAHSDIICSRITPLFFERKLAQMTDFADWRSSDSKWTRRAVPVSLLALRREIDPVTLLNFVEPLMTDPERVVHQGEGWFLRELWKIAPEPVEAFLLRYRNTGARLIFQYATEKMTREQKERYRKEKKK
jgi:hypothetical protein